MHDVGRILPFVFRKQIGRTEPRLLEILVPLWPRIVGKMIAQHAYPVAFDAGALTVAADAETWLLQLGHMKEELRAEINGFLGQPVVKKLRFRFVPQLHLFRSGTTPGSNIARGPAAPVAAMDTTPISDAEIARMLAGSYAKYFSRQRS